MSLLQAFGIALAVVLIGSAYIALAVKISDFVTRRTGSLDRGVLVGVIMLIMPLATAFIFAISNSGMWP